MYSNDKIEKLKAVSISFILPAYNVKAYLKQCVQSIENQHIENYEIIIIDDGSKDGTLNLAYRLAENNQNIIVIHQENGGVSAARNAGLNAAAGEYVAFVDPDDFYICEFAATFLRLAKENNLDLIRGQYRICVEDDLTERGSSVFSKSDAVLQGREYLKYSLLDNTLEVVPFLGLFRRSFLLKNEIYFPVGISYEEDQIHLFRALMQPDCRIMQTNTYFYAYRQRSTSVTHNYKPKQIYDIIKVIQLEEDELKKYHLEKKESCIYRKYMSASFYQITAIYTRLEKQDRRKVYKAIPKKFIVDSVRYPIRKRFAIKGILFLVCPEIIYYAVGIMKK